MDKELRHEKLQSESFKLESPTHQDEEMKLEVNELRTKEDDDDDEAIITFKDDQDEKVSRFPDRDDQSSSASQLNIPRQPSVQITKSASLSQPERAVPERADSRR